MENDIGHWFSFTVEVEEKLQSINTSNFSETYRSELQSLLGEIRNEIFDFPSLGPLKKQESYFKINSLGQDLRIAAYFAH